MSELIVTDERLEKSLQFLIDTDKEHGELRGYQKALEKKEKIILANESLKAKGSSMAENKAIAESSEEYKKHIEEYETTCQEFFIIDARRATAEKIIDVWRTQNANQRRGNI